MTDARITVSINDETTAAEPAADGSYLVVSKLLERGGLVELVFDIKAAAGDDLLIGKLSLPAAGPPGTTVGSTSWFAQVIAAVRHGAADHFKLMMLTLFAGLALGIGLQRRRRARALPALVLAVLAVAATGHSARAHEGHLEETAGPATRIDQLAASSAGRQDIRSESDAAHPRRPHQSRETADDPEGGSLRRPRHRQSQSQRPRPKHHRRARDRPGRRPSQDGANDQRRATCWPRSSRRCRSPTARRSRSGWAKSSRGSPSPRRSCKRLRAMAERSLVPQSLVVETEAELEGLRRRRDVVRETRLAPEVLRAPIDGVIGLSRVVAGQVVQAQDVLFQIVDPGSLWIEAYDYGDNDPATLKDASAMGAGECRDEAHASGLEPHPAAAGDRAEFCDLRSAAVASDRPAGHRHGATRREHHRRHHRPRRRRARRQRRSRSSGAMASRSTSRRGRSAPSRSTRPTSSWRPASRTAIASSSAAPSSINQVR